MSVFTDDISTHSTSEVANNSATTGITGWTWASSGSSAFQNATIVTDGGALGGKVLRFTDSGWGNNMFLYPTAIGSLGSAVRTEILVSWRVNNTTANHNEFYRVQIPCARSATTTGSQRYAVGFHKTALAIESQLFEFQDANDWTSVGAASTLTGFAAGDWWWTRLLVDTSNQWQWKSWKDGTSEPGYFISPTSATASTAGYVGIGFLSIDYGPIDIQFFSVGTAGSSPDNPNGGVSSPLLKMMQQLYAS